MTYSPGLRPLTVGDVMTTDVVTVGEAATFHQMVVLMQNGNFSALPVLGSDGALLGIVSEGDLLFKEAPPSDPSPNRLWPESREDRVARAKSIGINAAEVMTHPAATIRPGATLAAAARVMQSLGINRLPVVDEAGLLIGIASRRDLLAGFTRSDEELRGDIIDGVLPGSLGIAPGAVTVTVDGGVVTLVGQVQRRSDVTVVKNVVAAVDGVVRVDADLGYEFDDKRFTPSREGRIS